MITPIEAAELMPDSPDLFTLDEVLHLATEAIMLSARMGVGEAAIAVRTELRKDVVKALGNWGFVPHWTDYNTGWSVVVVKIRALAWFSETAIAAHRARQRIVMIPPP